MPDPVYACYMRWNMRPGRHQRDPTPLRDLGRPQRIDIPVYLDAGVALSLSASLSRGLVMESTVETAVANERKANARARAAVAPVMSVDGEIGGPPFRGCHRERS